MGKLVAPKLDKYVGLNKIWLDTKTPASVWQESWGVLEIIKMH